MYLVDHHIFAHNDNNYVFDVEKMTTAAIDEETALALTSIAADSNYQLKPEIKEKLIALGLIFDTKPEEGKKVIKPVPIVNISLFVTQNCNLNCVYCYGIGGNYGSSGHMSSATAKKAVDWLVEQSGEEKKLGISFFGGEPLMNFPLVKEVVEYTQQTKKENGKEFEFGITTNLTLMNDEMLAFFQEHEISPLISFDGPKEIQDKQRPFKNGKKSSYDVSVPKIKQLLSVMPDASCRATLMENVDPVDVRNSLREIGFTNIYISPESESLLNENIEKKARDLTRSRQMMVEDAELILKNVKDRNSEALKKSKGSSIIYKYLGNLLNDQKRYFPCGAGRGSVAVSNSGEVFLCHRFVGTEDYKLGTIHDFDLNREPYLKPPVETVDKCSKCFAGYCCAGGCYHENMGQTGSVFDPAEDQCRSVQQAVELAAYLTCHLNDDDRAYLVKEEIIPEKPPTQEEFARKKKSIIDELEQLGLTEEEFIELSGGLTPEEYRNSVLSRN